MTRRQLMRYVGFLCLGLICSCGAPATNNSARPANNSTVANATTATTPAAAAPTARKAEMTTTADALYKEYKADSKSMEKYKGKVVEISGKFSGTSGSGDAIDVKFDTGDPALWVTCRINPSAVQAAAKLQKGQDIKMTGIGDPMSIIGPLFKDCQMVP